jgi:hypothetical protein
MGTQQIIPGVAIPINRQFENDEAFYVIDGLERSSPKRRTTPHSERWVDLHSEDRLVRFREFG